MGARPLVYGLVLVCSVVPAVHADPPAKDKPESTDVSYYRNVRPIFQQNCQGCHQPAKRAGRLRHDHLRRPAQGGRKQPARHRARPSRQELHHPADHSAKTASRRRCPRARTLWPRRTSNLIKNWIAQGAKDDTPASAREVVDLDHPPVLSSCRRSLRRWTIRPTAPSWPFPAITRCCCTRRTARGWSGRLVGQSERIQSVAFSPDGKLLAVAGGSPGPLRRSADLGRGQEEAETVHSGDLRHGLRRQLVARWHQGGLRLRRQHAAGHRRPRPASRSCSREPITTGCWTPCFPRTGRTWFRSAGTGR